MGVIIKFIIIFLVVSYLIRRVGGFFLKLFFGESANNQQSRGRYYQQENSNTGKGSRYGSLRIFKKPKKDTTAEKNFTGGEYVDYEEVD